MQTSVQRALFLAPLAVRKKLPRLKARTRCSQSIGSESILQRRAMFSSQNCLSSSEMSKERLRYGDIHSQTRMGLQGTEPSKDIGHESSLPKDSKAATFNRRVLNKLQSAFDRNPEVDLLSKIPKDYSGRLQSRIEKPEGKGQAASESTELAERDNNEEDIRSLLDPTCPAEIVYPVSTSIKDVIGLSGQDFDGIKLSQHVSNLLSKSDVIQKGPFPMTRTIFKCSATAVVKVVRNADDYTEYTTLQFLDKHVTDVPAPKPLGLLRIGRLSLIFQSFILGRTLEETWPQMTTNQKLSIMDQLEKIFLHLRSTTLPPNAPLGGVEGEGCKDLRRHIRCSRDPIYSVEQFDDFLFSNIRAGTKAFVAFFRKFTRETSGQICLSHGDVRPANILVQRDDNGIYEISGLVDWEFSGFYPSHYESTKATNCLSTVETSDWYSYLPSCLSPYMWPQRWLLDYVLGLLIE